MEAEGELDELKLRKWLKAIDSDGADPSCLQNAGLGPLWAFLGFAKIPEETQTKPQTVNQDNTLFPSNAASQDLKLAKVRSANRNR